MVTLAELGLSVDTPSTVTALSSRRNVVSADSVLYCGGGSQRPGDAKRWGRPTKKPKGGTKKK